MFTRLLTTAVAAVLFAGAAAADEIYLTPVRALTPHASWARSAPYTVRGLVVGRSERDIGREKGIASFRLRTDDHGAFVDVLVTLPIHRTAGSNETHATCAAHSAMPPTQFSCESDLDFTVDFLAGAKMVEARVWWISFPGLRDRLLVTDDIRVLSLLNGKRLN